MDYTPLRFRQIRDNLRPKPNTNELSKALSALKKMDAISTEECRRGGWVWLTYSFNYVPVRIKNWRVIYNKEPKPC